MAYKTAAEWQEYRAKTDGLDEKDIDWIIDDLSEMEQLAASNHLAWASWAARAQEVLKERDLWKEQCSYNENEWARRAADAEKKLVECHAELERYKRYNAELEAIHGQDNAQRP